MHSSPGRIRPLGLACRIGFLNLPFTNQGWPPYEILTKLLFATYVCGDRINVAASRSRRVCARQTYEFAVSQCVCFERGVFFVFSRRVSTGYEKTQGARVIRH